MKCAVVERPICGKRRRSSQDFYNHGGQLRPLGFFQASRDSVLLPAHRRLSGMAVSISAASRPLKTSQEGRPNFMAPWSTNRALRTGLYAPGKHARCEPCDARRVLDPMPRTADHRFRLICRSGSGSVPPTSPDRRFRLSPQDCDRIVTFFRMKPVVDDREFGVLVLGEE